MPRFARAPRGRGQLRSDAKARPRPTHSTRPRWGTALYHAAWALCGSPTDAEDLVQTTFARVLARPRIIRRDNDRAYLLRALRNTYASHYRTLARRPATVMLQEDDALATPETAVTSREIMEAIASAPPLYRDAVIAVDVLGLSYRGGRTIPAYTRGDHHHPASPRTTARRPGTDEHR